MVSIGRWMLSAAALLLFTPSAYAQDKTILDAATSDPVKMGWMQGSPPPPDKLILAARGDHMLFPMTRWSFSHMREFVPTVRVSRGDGPVFTLPSSRRDDIDAVTFTPVGAHQPMRWDESLSANYTDAILILHKGRIVYERYLGVTTPDTRHAAFSVTKSFAGTIAEMLIAEGKLDETAPVVRYVPELARSGFANATARQVMDMTTGLAFSEDYADPNSGLGALLLASGLMPRPAGYAGPNGILAFISAVQKAGAHGEGFTSVGECRGAWLDYRAGRGKAARAGSVGAHLSTARDGGRSRLDR